MVFFNFFQLEWNTRKKIHSVNNIVWTTVVKQCLFAVSPTSAKYGMYFMMGPNDYTRSEKVNTSSPNLRIATSGNVQGLDMTNGSKNVILRATHLLTQREILSDVQWLDLRRVAYLVGI